MPIRTRFAPSPTGFVHIGSLRTALFSYLFARHNGGVNILRIEDTDKNRLVEGALENLVKVMHAMHIEFDEGYYWDSENQTVATKGDFGPYLQSERLEIYQKYAQELLDKKAAYYCYCSSERLEEVRREQTALKKPPMYDRKCRDLTDEERTKLLSECLAEGRKPVVRMAIPLTGKTIVKDLVYGDVIYPNEVLDDQVLLKADGFPTYHLAVVVDDHLMEITHVLRGEDWMPSTPKHVLLYEFFGWQPTQFAHLPNILNQNKTKLSKRHGDVFVETFLQKGYLPEALINFVALFGWNPKTEQEIFSLDELVREFDLSKVNKAGAVFDVNKLDWMNGKYIREMGDDILTEKLIPYWEEAGWITLMQNAKIKNQNDNLEFKIQEPNSKSQTISNIQYPISNFRFHLPSLDREVGGDYFISIASVEKERLKKLSDITEASEFYFKRPVLDEKLLAWKKSTLEDAKQKLAELKDFLANLTEEDFLRDNLEARIKEFIISKGYDVGSVLWPMRVSLTGLEKSSGPFEVASVLAQGVGVEEVLSRFDLEKLETSQK